MSDKKFISRAQYLKKVKPFIGKNLIKVIVGQRRVGKSVFLREIMNFLLASHRVNRNQVFYLNKENEEFFTTNDVESLLTWLHAVEKERKLENNIKKYVFIDEVQEIDGFEKAVRSLNASGEYDVYLTGSNANLLSSELATLLSGRYIEIEVFSLSYKEFLSFQKLQDSQQSLQKYLEFGSLPFLINLELTQEVVGEYLKNVRNTILIKDVVKRHDLRNVSFLENLVIFLAQHIGSLISAKKVSDFLLSQNIKISPLVVQNYLKYLTNSFLIHEIKRLDLNDLARGNNLHKGELLSTQGKKIFETHQKYYFEDLGMRNTIVGYKQSDFEKIIENIVCTELLRRGYGVYVGQLPRGKEIDFVAERKLKGGVHEIERIYIQVAFRLDKKKTIQREVGNLLEIQDNYPKLLLSWEPEATGNYQGVSHRSLREWLLDE